MLNRTVTTDMTAAEALFANLMPRTATRMERQAFQYVEAGKAAHELFKGLHYLCAECGLALEEPAWTAGDIEDGIKKWCDAVCDQMHADKIGRLTLEGEHATYSWYDVKKSSTLLDVNLTRLKATHKILHPKFRKIPVSFAVPPKAKRMLNCIESIDPLRRSCRVVQGMLIGESEDVLNSWTERTAAGKALDTTVDAGKKAMQMIKKGIGSAANMGGTLMDKAAKATHSSLQALTAVAAGDPAIVLGSDIVFFGWKD